MPNETIKRLRQLRERADRLLANLPIDLMPFAMENGTFRRKPTSDKAGDVNVTTTCSCLMSLALTDRFSMFYSGLAKVNGRLKYEAAIVLRLILKASWKSTGLTENNAFTTVLVLRTFAMLSHLGVTTGTELADASKCQKKAWGLLRAAARTDTDLAGIARELATDISNFGIESYPPSSAVIYWFVDAVRRFPIELPPASWSVLCQWSSTEFRRQLSLVVSDNDAMMDPVAMTMSACLCARLLSICRDGQLGAETSNLEALPSEGELQFAIKILFQRQNKSGIWNKYFPLFHYPKSGSNFCFTFELLEAVLCEFGSDEYTLMADDSFVDGLDRALVWCENERLRSSVKGVVYSGWNSGGDLVSLQLGYAESWATAVVHMFLSELSLAASCHIQYELLRKYNASLPKPARDGMVLPSQINKQLNTEILLQGKVRALNNLLLNDIVAPCKSHVEKAKPEILLRRRALKKDQARSALLFGPPGTSKTKVVGAIADELGWPLVELSPADFVRDSLANVYSRAEEIFIDLLDLAGVVVFFDEMEALVPTRDGKVLPDITSQFLTTTILPKLSKLHEGRRILFFMATNFQERFDAAIKRSGRFDFLLCMGPPTAKEKRDKLHAAYFLDKKTAQTKKAGISIEKFLSSDQRLKDQFELLTFGEWRAFLQDIASDKNIGDEVQRIGKANLRTKLEKYSEYVTLKVDDMKVLIDFGADLAALKKAKLTLDKVKEKLGTEDLPAVARYLCDWAQSKRQ